MTTLTEDRVFTREQLETLPLEEILTNPYKTAGAVTVKRWITPEDAQALKSCMKPNRNLRPAVAKAYSRDMKAGLWRDTGESIKIDTDGEMIDGDHRVTGIIDSGATVLMSVTFGVDPEDRKFIDVGAKRKSSDVLTFGGYKNATVLAATMRLGILDGLGFLETSGGLKTGGGTYQATRAQELAFLSEHPELPSVVNRYTQIARRIFMPTGAFCYAMSILEQISASDAQLFAESIDKGQTTGEGDPRWTLFAYAKRSVLNKLRIGNGEAMWLVFTAWNAWRDQKDMKTIRPFLGTKEKPIVREIPTPH